MIYIQESKDIMKFLGVNFIENSALFGGAIDIFLPNQIVSQAVISDCLFIHNIGGDSGGAIYFDQEFGRSCIIS